MIMPIFLLVAAMLMVLRILFPDFLGGLNLQLSLSCEAGNEVVQARTIVICLSTVIALAPYRRATLHMCCMDRHKKFSFSQTWINRRISFLPTTTIF
ncbi:hypothetical protein Tcan_02933 [Toxocara canis]|uniref:Uncharacterized protein n=1 Tax=Toxocara canis TaxID=6265 RepID=A0A0B2V2M2_TOXCA|nr:hypothetical protein Tcan_02933 [Toxocara canis]